jgi:hypothetical protein
MRPVAALLALYADAALLGPAAALAGFTETAEFGESGTISVAWAGYDLDGDLDVAVGDYSGNNWLFVNGGGGVFTQRAEFGDAGTFVVLWADFDNDGGPDMTVGNGHTPPTNYPYTNDEGGADYLIISLVGHYHDMGLPYSNRDGIGAKITLCEAGHLGDAAGKQRPWGEAYRTAKCE